MTIFVDNDGVTAAFINGSSNCPEVNAMVAVFWLQIAELQADSVFHRVESAANIADGPTRPDKEGISVLTAVGAEERPACLPGWLLDLWHPYASDVLRQQDIVLTED